jgi:hypothetical protein
MLVNTMLDMIGLSLRPEVGLILGLPMLLNELFLGGWLIVKGFNPSPLTSTSSRPT